MRLFQNIGAKLNQLVGDDGIKSDVKVEITDESIKKLVLGLLAAGFGIVVIAHTVKLVFRNRDLQSINTNVIELKKLLAHQ